MHPLFFPLFPPQLKTDVFALHCLITGTSGCYCVRNEAGNKAFYLYILISMTSIDLFSFLLLQFSPFIISLFHRVSALQNASRVDNKRVESV